MKRLPWLPILLTLLLASFAAAQEQPVVLKAGLLLDGSGQVLRNTRVVIQGAKIAKIDPWAEGVNYDLSGLTLLPGWIDTHPGYSMNPCPRVEVCIF